MAIKTNETFQTILFVFRDPGRIRYFERSLELLAERGHRLHLAVERFREQLPGQFDFANDLAARFPNVVVEQAAARERGPDAKLARALRLALDGVHYQHPRFDRSADFRARAAADSPAGIRDLFGSSQLAAAGGVDGLAAALVAIEREVPRSPAIDAFIAERSPDVVVVTPLVWFSAPQTDWLRSAKALGVRTGACLFSWDNLTSKGSLRELPDFLTVWNDAQRTEAAEFHGVPADRVVVTGAQNWDLWFDWEPSRTREQLCAEAGLPADRPYVLWLQSSNYVGDEGSYVREWIEHLRGNGGPAVRDAAILVRPHPQVVDDEWEEIGLDRYEAVAVHPRRGQVPLDGQSRRDFFDTLHHAAAVVGVNTSSFIEAAILDRPAFTVLEPRFERGQRQTIHFHHLLEANGGPVRAAASLTEHCEQLEAALTGRDDGSRGRSFVEAFVRPHGRDEKADVRIADAIESAPRRDSARLDDPASAPVTDAMLVLVESALTDVPGATAAVDRVRAARSRPPAPSAVVPRERAGSAAPRVVIGLPMYNGGPHLAEAVDSLLAQTFDDFAIVVTDDRSDDGSERLLSRYAEWDPRIHYERNRRRLGLTRNWRRAYEACMERFPRAELFAFGSDHDVWHPRFLERMVAELDARPDAVLAYPRGAVIGADGVLAPRPSSIDTTGIGGRERLWRMAREMRAGYMVYGVARADAVRRAGGFRHVLFADRLWLTELALEGELVEVDEVLYYKRPTAAAFTAERQQRACFPDGTPLQGRVPWWIAHAGALARRSEGGPRAAAQYAWANGTRQLQSRRASAAKAAKAKAKAAAS